MQYKNELLDKFGKLLNRRTLLLAILIAIFLIVFAVGLGWYNNRIVPITTNPVARYNVEPHNFLSFMSNWDGPSYISIAKDGYQNVSQASFFPLYPLLVRIVNKVISSGVDSALLISWTSLALAVFFYLKVLKTLFKLKDNLMAVKGVIFFILFPTSIFLVATYTESLFAFLALAAIYYALNKRYVISSMFLLLGSVTHLDGIFMIILVALILLEEKVHPLKIIQTAVIGLLGVGAYSIYLADKFNKPLAFISAQRSHGWLNLHYSEVFKSVDFFNVVFIILLIASIVYWWKRRRSFSVYSFLFLLIPIIGNQFGGFNRYMLMAFPVQFMAYDLFKNKQLAYSLLIGGMGIIWAYFALQYAGGYIGG